MLFRYKITKRYDYTFTSLTRTVYDVKIQRYNHSAHVCKWKTCANTTLNEIHALLKPGVHFEFDDNLSNIIAAIQEYDGVDKLITRYIYLKIIDQEVQRNKKNDIEQALDSLVLTKGWNTIEVKENE